MLTPQVEHIGFGGIKMIKWVKETVANVLFGLATVSVTIGVLVLFYTLFYLIPVALGSAFISYSTKAEEYLKMNYRLLYQDFEVFCRYMLFVVPTVLILSWIGKFVKDFIGHGKPN